MKQTCDIFCNVIDNYGDIGVCWRLARQLANEHEMAVRLWVDDLASFRKLCPQVDVELEQQRCHGVEVRHWVAPFPKVDPAQLVIEAFACELPPTYVAAMAEIKNQSAPEAKMDARRQGLGERDSTSRYSEGGEAVANIADASIVERKPVWINLEYLSAEEWVAGCHGLPSPHSSLPLVKYFFFPGFTPSTGGLLLERGLLARRDAFQRDPATLNAFWQGLGVAPRRPDEIRVSLFSYENPGLHGLLGAWAEGDVPVTCLVPEGRALPQVAAFFGRGQAAVGDSLQHDNLTVHVLPFVEQERYDFLLWACDINFVRGEDSCVRAQWAGKPMVWHIYPQHDGVHMRKLRALCVLYAGGLSQGAAQALEGMWLAWNDEGDAATAWTALLPYRGEVEALARGWAWHLAGNSLALNLLDFSHEIDRMRGLQK